MTADPAAAAAAPGAAGRLAANIHRFARCLRAAGLAIGTDRVRDAITAVETVGIERRADVYWALHAALVRGPDQRALFDQAFHVFWRDPDLLGRMVGMMRPTVTVPVKPADVLAPRVAEALRAGRAPVPAPARVERAIEATGTWSDRERLGRTDFEKMTTRELALVKQALARLSLPVPARTARRRVADPRGRRIDFGATLRRAVRTGGVPIALARTRAERRPRPLVVLCDISGSMDRYARMVLHFVHAVTNDRARTGGRVHSFVFGTRLTEITRHLARRDVDDALDAVAGAVTDWSGGTRIGACLRMFNREWSRRVLGQGAVVLLITDGLDRDAGAGLEAEIDRLHRSAARLIWLNPLLRFDGFEARPAGIRAMRPHVDDFRPVHSLDSLIGLAAALSGPGGRAVPPPSRSGARP